MSEPFYKLTPSAIVGDSGGTVKSMYRKCHEALVADITNKKRFEALIPDIVTPKFVALYCGAAQGMVVNEVSKYVESLIPKREEFVTVVEKDENGQKTTVPKLDENGKPLKRMEPIYELSTQAYKDIRKIVNTYYPAYSTYWRARLFVEKTIPKIDEVMFDRMNDYLWRHIMAVVCPDDVKREFKHVCINVKRKLYYLGDRNRVFNQTVFGLYDDNIGGTGKTTLLQGFANAFSDENPMVCRRLDELFGFNARTADKFGICFVDENARGAKTEVKDAVKAFIDADTRTIEFKGVDGFDVNHLLTLVVSANHKISNRLFEDEARGQRRDACFEVIGLLQQYTQADATKWFEKMFEFCPIEDDQRTYRHHNPHNGELSDGEMSIMSKIVDNITDPPRGNGWKLGELAAKLELRSRSDEWHRLRTLLDTDYFDTLQDHDRSKYYVPKIDKMREKLNGRLVKKDDIWTIDWRDSRPYLDIDATIAKLAAGDYDTNSPITYEAYFDPVEGV